MSKKRLTDPENKNLSLPGTFCRWAHNWYGDTTKLGKGTVTDSGIIDLISLLKMIGFNLKEFEPTMHSDRRGNHSLCKIRISVNCGGDRVAVLESENNKYAICCEENREVHENEIWNDKTKDVKFVISKELKPVIQDITFKLFEMMRKERNPILNMPIQKSKEKDIIKKEEKKKLIGNEQASSSTDASKFVIEPEGEGAKVQEENLVEESSPDEDEIPIDQTLSGFSISVNLSPKKKGKLI